MPKRVQMTRQRPWRADHPDAVIVARPSKWGNPFTIAECIDAGFADTTEDARARCVEAFRSVLLHDTSSPWWHEGSRDRIEWIAARTEWIAAHIDELADRDLACWCPLDQPCYADVFLELSMGPYAQ